MSDQPQAPTDKPVITEKTYPIGATLERVDAETEAVVATFKVQGVWRGKKKPRQDQEFKGYVGLLTTTKDDISFSRQTSLSVKELEIPPERGGWGAKKAAPVAEPAPVITAEQATGVKPDYPDDFKPATDIVDHANPADVIAQLQKKVEALEAERHDLIEARDSAISMYDVASQRAREIGLELQQYQDAERDKQPPTVSADDENDTIADLTEALAEARAELASLKSAPSIAKASDRDTELADWKAWQAARNRPTTHVLMQWLPQHMPERLPSVNKELDDMLACGWHILDISVTAGVIHEEGKDHFELWRVVTLQNDSPAPTAPEPLRTSAASEPVTEPGQPTVKKVGPQVTIFQPDEIPGAAPEPTRAGFSTEQMMQAVLETGKRVYEETIANSPIPPYRPISTLLTSGAK